MPSTYALKYLLDGIAAAPDTQEALCSRVVDWDARPAGEDRFSVRESLAHLADWEPIWMQRMSRTVNEDFPSLPNADEGQMAIDHAYASIDPQVSLRQYQEKRAELATYLSGLPLAAWDRKCHREGVGDLSLYDMAAIILGHDNYHFRHTLDSLKVRT